VSMPVPDTTARIQDIRAPRYDFNWSHRDSWTGDRGHFFL